MRGVIIRSMLQEELCALIHYYLTNLLSILKKVRRMLYCLLLLAIVKDKVIFVLNKSSCNLQVSIADKKKMLNSRKILSPYVGSLARLRKRQTLSIDPCCSKSDLKKRAASMFTYKDNQW